MSRVITYEELPALALGAGILGTGGGTHPYLELLNLEKLYRDGNSVTLLDAVELADEDLVAEVGYMGAPLASKERLTDPRHAARPVRMMEELTGRRFKAIMPSEIGTANGVRHALAAAYLGLPVVDADAIGRGIPEMQMNTFSLAGLPLHPFAFADIRDNEAFIVQSETALWAERIGRRMCTEMGAIAATCRPPRRGSDIRAHAILGSVSRAIRIGRAVLQATDAKRDPVSALLGAEPGTLLFTGKVKDVWRRTTAGFLRGVTAIAGVEEYAGKTLVVDFQNEFTVARCAGEVWVSVPDLVCILDRLTGEAIGTETIRYGLRVAVVVLPAPPILKTPAALAVVGPRGFGYDFDYAPLDGDEDLR